MRTFVQWTIAFIFSVQSSIAFAWGPRPLYSKKELLQFVQKNQHKKLDKTQLLKLLQTRYRSPQDQKFIKRVAARAFSHLEWTLAYEDSKILMKISQPEPLTLTLSELDRLFLAAVINGREVSLKGGLAKISQQLESAFKPKQNVFNLLFLPEAEALWPVLLLGVAALGALFGGAIAMQASEQEIESTFEKILENCEKDLAAKRASPSAATLGCVQDMSKYGFDAENPKWYPTQEQCLEENGDHYSRNYCRISAEIHQCMSQLENGDNAVPSLPATPVSL